MYYICEVFKYYEHFTPWVPYLITLLPLAYYLWLPESALLPLIVLLTYNSLKKKKGTALSLSYLLGAKKKKKKTKAEIWRESIRNEEEENEEFSYLLPTVCGLSLGPEMLPHTATQIHCTIILLKTIYKLPYQSN